jgi:CTP:molybdopterin cytidylyltransferase MocA
LLAAGAALGDERPVVVAGADREAIERAAPAGCDVLFNPAWSLGRAGGILLAHGQRPGRALCLAPVDVPLVPASVFEALARKWDELGEPARGWLAPRLERPPDSRSGRFGHPVVVGPDLLDGLAALGPGADLRALRSAADPLAAVAVEAAEILDDLDLPADLDRLRRRLERA